MCGGGEAVQGGGTGGGAVVSSSPLKGTNGGELGCMHGGRRASQQGLEWGQEKAREVRRLPNSGAGQPVGGEPVAVWNRAPTRLGKEEE